MSEYTSFEIGKRGGALVAIFQSESGGSLHHGRTATVPLTYNLRRLDQRIERLDEQGRDATVERQARTLLADALDVEQPDAALLAVCALTRSLSFNG